MRLGCRCSGRQICISAFKNIAVPIEVSSAGGISRTNVEGNQTPDLAQRTTGPLSIQIGKPIITIGEKLCYALGGSSSLP